MLISHVFFHPHLAEMRGFLFIFIFKQMREQVLREAGEIHVERAKVFPMPLSEKSTVLVGIGGHDAPPNSRLYSYVLPAIDALDHAHHQKSRVQLLLSSSVLDKRKRAPENTNIEVQTFAKVHSLIAFIQEFFPDTFSRIDLYLGEEYCDLEDEALLALWNSVREVDVHLADEYQEKKEHWGVSDHSFLPYACKHALWFRDIVSPTDREMPYDSERWHLTFGGHQEIFFNRFRNALVDIGLLELQEQLQREVQVHRKRILVCTTDKTCCPYGEMQSGKGEKRKSIERTLALHDDPFSERPKVQSDIDYIIDRLQVVAGIDSSPYAAKDAFEAFWLAERSEYARICGELEIYLQHFQKRGYRNILCEVGIL